MTSVLERDHTPNKVKTGLPGLVRAGQDSPSEAQESKREPLCQRDPWGQSSNPPHLPVLAYDSQTCPDAVPVQ